MEFNELAKKGLKFKRDCVLYIVENLEFANGEEILLSDYSKGKIIGISKENFSFTCEYVDEYDLLQKQTVCLLKYENISFSLLYELALSIAVKKGEDHMLIIDLC